MATFLVAVVVFAAALLGMAIGVMASNRCLQGSCGGLSNLPEGEGKSICSACTTEPSKMQPHDSHAAR